MAVSGNGFLSIKGGIAPAQFAETIARMPLCRNGKPSCRNFGDRPDDQRVLPGSVTVKPEG